MVTSELANREREPARRRLLMDAAAVVGPLSAALLGTGDCWTSLARTPATDGGPQRERSRSVRATFHAYERSLRRALRHGPAVPPAWSWP